MKEKGKTSKSKEQQQTIKCDVESCVHNDEENHCDLDEIQVSSEISDDYVAEKDETICDSYETKES